MSSVPTIRPRDLVRVGSGAGMFYAEVRRTSREGVTRGRLEVRPLRSALGHTREVLVRETTGHWRYVR
jgi:hypothetical protein